jgi:hypothetical protein
MTQAKLMKLKNNIIKIFGLILLIFLLSPLKLQANLVNRAYRIANKRHVKHVPVKPSNWFVHTGKYYNEAKKLHTGKSDSLVLMNKYVYDHIRTEQKTAKKNSEKKHSFSGVKAQQIMKTAQNYNRATAHNQNATSSQSSNGYSFQSMSNNFSGKTQLARAYSK